jgi:hypothetical protein
MKPTKPLARWILPGVILFVAFVVSAKSAPALKAGAAEIDITPPVGIRMAGYFNERLSTGTHDPLKAKAIVLNDGKEKIALVFCDLVGPSLNVTSQARAQAGEKIGVPVRNIMICATHSHTGPLFDNVIYDYLHDKAVAERGKDDAERIDYPKFLIEQLVRVIEDANAKLKPAQLEVGIGKQEGLGFNRRYHMKNGTVAFNPGQMNTNIVRAAGPTDPDVPFLLVRDAQGSRPLAGVTVFAMHCDTIGGTEYSADYPFFLQQFLRASFGPEFISAFGAGTCGDINQINVNTKEPFKGFGPSGKYGETLGKTVLASQKQLKAITRPAFAVRNETIQAPLRDVTPAELADATAKMEQLTDENAGFMMKVVAVRTLDLARKGSHWPLEVQVFRLDADTAMVCLPCEIFVELGLAIKQASPFKRTVVISICNDRPSYVPTKKAFTEGSYEITNARVKPGVGETLVETATGLLKKLK